MASINGEKQHAHADTQATRELDSSPHAHPAAEEEPKSGLPRWRLAVILVSVFLGFFLSLLDTTIVAVALTTISNEFGAFDLSAWVLTAYLLTYLAFSIIISRLSDIFGRFAIEVGCFVWFAAWSLGCALSQSMIQLIVFRALQGIGGSGLYALCMTIGLESLPPKKRGNIAGVIGLFQTISAVMGPLVGGALSSDGSGDWRFIFYLNLPICGIAVLGLGVAWPKGGGSIIPTKSPLSGLATVDFLGSFLLLSASTLLITALQTGGAYQLDWNSGAIISMLVLAFVCFVSFLGWQWFLGPRDHLTVKPVFPLVALKERVLSASLVTVGLSGFVFYVAVINIPERSEIVDVVSPVTAGIRLLPMMCASAVGALFTGGLSAKWNVTAPCLVSGAAFQMLGYGLMTTLPEYRDPGSSKIYGFQVFIGLGFGMIICATTIQASLHAPPALIAVTQGAMAQARNLGGAIGLAVATIIFNNGLRSSSAIEAALSPDQRTALYKSPLVIQTLQPNQQILISMEFAKAFTQEMRVALYVSAACFVSSLFTFSKVGSVSGGSREMYRPPGAARSASNKVEQSPSGNLINDSREVNG